ncbi:MAG: hypothetical protein H0U28_03055 [Nocardioidaceae bacterium]|nr:hypothetical protein [Nocardioidaceae bacterium]
MQEPDPLRGEVSVQGVPDDARRMGLDRNTEEGALIAMTGSLSPTRLSHKLVAWAILLSFVAPGLLLMLTVIF